MLDIIAWLSVDSISIFFYIFKNHRSISYLSVKWKKSFAIDTIAYLRFLCPKHNMVNMMKKLESSMLHCDFFLWKL